MEANDSKILGRPAKVFNQSVFIYRWHHDSAFQHLVLLQVSLFHYQLVKPNYFWFAVVKGGFYETNKA